MAKNYMVLYGKNSVLERLKTYPATVRKVFLQESLSDKRIERLIREKNIPCERLSVRRMNQMRPAKDMQGVIARVDIYTYKSFSEVLQQAEKNRETVVFLDRINDPQNLGVLMRILACLGGFSLVIPEFKSCEINETVLHVASGSENYISVAKVVNFSNAILALKKQGYWIAGAVVDEDAQDLRSFSFPFPLCLVLGSEGDGIRYGIAKHLDIKVRIPMEGAGLSFNVSMASAILGYEITRQRSTR